MLVISLPHYEFVRVSGEDSRSFLQGQLSCDMEQLSLEQSLQGALCNLQGRVIADFRVLQHKDSILLQTQANQADRIIETLAKYAVFSKVVLEKVSADPDSSKISAFGIDTASGEASTAGLLEIFPQLPDQFPDQDNESRLSDEVALIKLPGSATRFEIWDSSESQETATRLSNLPAMTSQHWLTLQMRAGEIHVSEDMSAEYTPQLLNYDISGVINFKKGCYTGQEIVARMFYRGTAKKRLYLLAQSGTSSEVIKTIHHDGKDYPVILSNKLDEGAGEEAEESLYFAVLESDSAESGASFSSPTDPDAKLSVLPLPYGDKGGV